MTFDFVPDWLETLCGSADCTGATPTRVSPPLPAAAPHPSPSPAELALLVGELFTEGSLSWDQLRSLVAVPELGPHLQPALAATPAGRRLLSRR
ncbi:MAG: hypothetical protein ACM31L_06510 [Actinomycetota bacterium]